MSPSSSAYRTILEKPTWYLEHWWSSALTSSGIFGEMMYQDQSFYWMCIALGSGCV